MLMQGRVFLGRYETIRQIGEGGMGRVYLAKQTDLGRQVVVKVMHDRVAADPTFRERFARETLLMARFQHPYAVTLYDASLNDPEGPCIVMEYIRGITLDEVLRKNGRLSPGRVGRILGQLCEVLQAAHAEGIIHRDLKPGNLMIVDADSPYEMLKVMDFGLAKLISKGASNHGIVISNAEFAVGTPGYMCPEQARGEDMDNRGDLYSVGVILYELLTGRLPFAGRSTMDMLLAHATEEPPPFAYVSHGIEVPAAIEEVVKGCLTKDPNERPTTARDLAERYERALSDTSTAAAAVQLPKARSVPAPRMIAPSQPSPVLASSPSSQGLQQVASPPTPLPETTPSSGSLDDPLAVIHYLEAWMPETIATYKLRGFIDDVGGEVIESVPGRIKVRLGGKSCVYNAPAPRGSFSWLGIGRRAAYIDMELRLNRADSRGSHLRITMILRSSSPDVSTDGAWRKICGQIFCDLRGYLMAQAGAVSDPVS
jgi:eukaryotic-like serine/threonine-protein kinase